MERYRKYGNGPFHVALIHGGPGAAGEMAPVAVELASARGIIEPLQRAMSVQGQLDELRTILENFADGPVTLVGFSWGAWLSFLFAATQTSMVKKLVLIGSGGFEEPHAAATLAARLGRLGEAERAEAVSILALLEASSGGTRSALVRLGLLFSKTDAFDPIFLEPETIDARMEIFQKVWQEGSELRKSGKLLEYGRRIQCPVVALHSDYDPHPAAGVRGPLAATVKDFQFIVLEHCGHKPWIERQAKDEFYRILNRELA